MHSKYTTIPIKRYMIFCLLQAYPGLQDHQDQQDHQDIRVPLELRELQVRGDTKISQYFLFNLIFFRYSFCKNEKRS